MSNTIIIKPCKLLPKTNYKYSLTKEYIIFLLTIKTHEKYKKKNTHSNMWQHFPYCRTQEAMEKEQA